MNARVRVTGTMTDSDALLWTIGRDPVLRTTIVAVMVLDQPPDFGDLRVRVQSLTDAVPRLRSKVHERPMGWGRPLFVEDSRFNLDLHVSRVMLPPPGTLRSVLDLAQAMATTGFDPQLPQWESVVVEGIERGRAAFVIKLHHALVDGVGGIAVLSHLLDARRRRAAPASKVRSRAPSTSGGGVSGAVPERNGESGDGHRETWRAADLLAARASSHFSLVGEIGRLVSTTESAARLLAPARKPVSPLMTERSIGRRFEVIDLSAPALRRAAAATAGTINDVFVAGAVMGLRRYHDLHGVELESLRALMPVNIREGDDSRPGNRFVPARFLVPVPSDPEECLRQVKRIAGSWKHAPGLALSDVVAAALVMLPPPLVSALWGSMLKGDDFCVTNVPGPSFETFLAGSHVERIYAFAPPSGAAMNIALVTPAGRACVGVNVDEAAVPDSAELAASLEEGFGKVLKLGGPIHAVSS